MKCAALSPCPRRWAVGVIIRPRGLPVPPPAHALPFRGCPCSGLSWVHSPGRQNSRVRRSQATTWGRGHCGAPKALHQSRAACSRTATRSRALQEAGRWPGTGVQGEDRRPGAVSPGPRAVRTGPGRGRESAEKAGAEAGRSRRSPGPGPGRPPPAVTTRPPSPRAAPRVGLPSRLLPAPPGRNAGSQSRSRSPGTRARRRSREPDSNAQARPPLGFGY